MIGWESQVAAIRVLGEKVNRLEGRIGKFPGRRPNLPIESQLSMLENQGDANSQAIEDLTSRITTIEGKVDRVLELESDLKCAIEGLELLGPEIRRRVEKLEDTSREY